MYGFEGEVKQKYSSQMVELFTEVFNYLPLAHIIGGKILVRLYSHVRMNNYSYCMYMYIVQHAALSPNGNSMHRLLCTCTELLKLSTLCCLQL